MRTFIAIDLPAAVKQQLHTLQRRLQAELRPLVDDRLLRWTNPDKIHLTLRFLGDTTDAQTRRLAADLHAIAAETRPFNLHLGGIGVFPNWSRFRVLWVGVQGDLEALHAVQQSVEMTVQQVGFEPEPKAFAPHLTLARTSNEARADEVRRAGEFLRTLAAQPAPSPGASWPVDELIHMQSQLRPEGAIYTPIVKGKMKNEE